MNEEKNPVNAKGKDAQRFIEQHEKALQKLESAAGSQTEVKEEGNFIKLKDGVFPHPAKLMEMMNGLHDRIEELEKSTPKEEKEEWISELKKALLNFDEACEENREYGGWYHYTELVDFIETTFRQFTPPKQAEQNGKA